MLDTINFPISEITTEILRNYLAGYKSNSNARMVILGLLISTGMRVRELTRLNISDMNFQERSCIVLGKGNSDIEIAIRNLGREANINKVHPHKFRRTMETMAIDKGMPVEQVKKLLGHIKIDTTMEYAMVSQNNVKNSHRKYIT